MARGKPGMAEQDKPQSAPTGTQSEPAVSPAQEQQAKRPTAEEVRPETPAYGARSVRQPLMNRTDFPYVVTLLLAFFAWALTHAVDRLTAMPLVKLTQTIEEQVDRHELTFEFKNITSRVNFEDLTIRILGETDKQRFTEPTTTVIGGGWDGDAHLFEAEDGIRLTFPDFHPGWELAVTTVMTGGGMPRVQLESAGVPAILEPVGLRTRLVEWELYIIASFAGLALAIIITWVRKQ